VSAIAKRDNLVPMDVAEVQQFLKRAERGDAATLPALREMLKNRAAIDLLGGNLARQVERSLVADAAGKNLALKEALLRQLEVLRADLAGPNPTPVERLLAERAVTCWLHLYDLEVRFVQSRNLTINQADYQQRALDRAHKRYLSALKALVTVRKLALPALQVNIADQQVNMASR
jgi:hypothetical protein